MKSFSELANSGTLYLLVIIALLFMIGLCLVFWKQSRARALELGISEETLKKIRKNALSASVIPSVAIVAGLITLSAVIGIPWAWFRLSVVGSVSYELIAAQLATSALGFSDMTQAMESGADTFGAVMLVMSTGIIAGVFINALFGKQIIGGVNKLGQNKSGFGTIVNSCFMLALMPVLAIFQIFQGVVSTLVLVTSLLIAFILKKIVEKTGWAWLGDFIMAFTLILGMASAVFWTQVI